MPFDVDRSGIVVGEGCAMVVLESGPTRRGGRGHVQVNTFGFGGQNASLVLGAS
jgi:3-oxoacyl-(acyl-carrier-protein) synthase